MSKQRFEITGEWSGPNNPAGDYTRFQHREYTTDHSLALWVTAVHGIRFSDGTMLYLTARPLKVGERVGPTKDGYGKLIRDCKRYNVDSVDALVAAERMELALSKPAEPAKTK